MTEKPLNVRMANINDEIGIFNLLTDKLWNENGTFSVSPSKVMAFIRSATRGEGGVIGIIDGANGDIAGVIGLNMGTFWYSDDWHLEEYFNFIKQEYRRSEYAKNLIDFSKWFSEQMKMILNIGIISTVRTEAKVRLYERKLQCVGAFFMHNLHLAKGPIGIDIKGVP